MDAHGSGRAFDRDAIAGFPLKELHSPDEILSASSGEGRLGRGPPATIALKACSEKLSVGRFFSIMDLRTILVLPFYKLHELVR